ncbi:hypothetical protein HPP92_011006 [Vanilla planifolia]|uniref:B-block binding subunit of TFIIIC domain-containing protein n=1 Tax=Vanilla planifolia TaxID=51239 RepID=A0A835RBJ9_VANPL|nr:hypothetical protein HPP92_011006 [Vanilla planifolia]
MDDIISSAVEEICVQGASGIRIAELWRNLHATVSSCGFQLSIAVKKVIWGRLLAHPGLQFMSSGSILERKAVCRESLEGLERIELSIVADEHLRDSFLGLYDLKQAPHYEISHVQRRVLERLAMARLNFYIISSLFCALSNREVWNFSSEDFLKENVCIKDYIPAMKAICERLEAASDKVDVVSGIKSALGYRKSSGHRAWRAILSRLKYAGLVEELKAEVGGKDVPCLRLLKNFDPKYVQPKTIMHGYDRHEVVDMKYGKRGQITDQIVELPLEHRIYDMIDAEGKKGMTTLELSKRLGISSKILHKRVLVLCQRFGVVSQSEIHDKTQVYRFWTHRSKYQDPSYWSFNNCNLLLDACMVSTPSGDLVPHESSFDFGLKEELLLVDNVYSGKELVSYGARHFAEVVECEREPEAQMEEVSAMDCDVVCNSGGTIESSSLLSSPQTQRYACRMSTGFAAKREQRILEKLKNEKFLLKVELHKWLEDVEKDKPSTKDRKTLDRSLKRLQDAGLCKSIIVQIPSLSNFNSLRRREAIFHSSANSSAKLPLEIYERHRSFDIQSRRPGSTNLKPDLPTADITGLRNMKRTSVRVVDKSASKIMIENGFVLSKMIRAKLLHKFLWGYLNNSPYWRSALNSSRRHGGEDGSNPADDCQFVSLDEAIKEMPLFFFFTVKQYRCFMDTQATARLSSIVYILYRLRLIQLVNNRSVQDINLLSYSLELQTYIEEPMLAVLPSNIKMSDDYCKLRHDFLLSDQLSVDKYWETLEYCFAGSDPASSQKCFPGSVVGEVTQRRSWSSARVMTTEQRMELHRRLTCGDQTKKIPFIECVKIASELNITLEQVLRFSYDKRQARFSECSSHLNSGRSQQCENENNVGAFLRKRRRLSSDNLQDQVKIAAGAGEIIGMTASASVKSVSDLYSSPGLPKASYEDASMASFINQCAFDDLKPTRNKRFFWTYDSDRQLIMLYARHRAMLGARFFRVEWPALSDLPAQPRSCKRRMAYLNRKSNIRKAVLRLCSLLGERYNNYLGSSDSKIKLKSVDHNENNHGSEGFMSHGTAQNDSASSEGTCKLNFQQYSWDDFEDPDVKMALDDVLKYRKLAKLEDAKRVGARVQKGWLNNRSLNPAKFSSPEQDDTSSAGGVFNNSATEVPNISDRSTQSRSNNNVYHGNFLKFRGKISVKQISKSLSLANAVELLKLVFLSNSKAVGVQASLATTLQKFSHSDIYAAFNFLREKNFLVVGRGSHPFILSRKFFYNVFSSPFPNNSGKRATNFSSWLQKHQQNLIQGGVAIASDLQCGEMFHLFSLVFSGELSISPQLPNEGIGEAVELKTFESLSSVGGIGDDDVVNNSKRKNDMPSISENAKRHKPQLKADGDRRGRKGFLASMFW